MPPEYMIKGEISNKYDIFSLGVIIIEIITGPEGYSRYLESSPQEFIEQVRELFPYSKITQHISMYTTAC